MLSPGLSLCPEESALVGAMVVNYGELEFCLTQCLGTVLNDNTLAFRLVYRDRGEDRRINICDTLIRPRFAALKLEDVFVETIDQVRHCKMIRNQYAHGWFSWSAFSIGSEKRWGPRVTTLKLVSLEDAVDDPAGINAEPKNLPVALLKEQADYFINAQDWVMWLQHEAEKAAGKPLEKIQRPKRASKPKRWVEP